MQIKTRVKWLIFRRYITAKKLKLFSERVSKIFILLGLGLLIGIVILYWFNDHNFDSNYQINDNKLSSFGDIIGGLIGSIWALAGYILYYVALKDQRKDIEINQNALVVQVDTFKQQIEEYKLQRDELVLTRKVLNEQSSTLLKQQFESTFFNSLNLLNDLIEKLKFEIVTNRAVNRGSFDTNIHYDLLSGKDTFIKYLEKFKSEYMKKIKYKIDDTDGVKKGILDMTSIQLRELIINTSHIFFEHHQKLLGQYFRTVNNILKFLDKNKKSIKDSEFYMELFRDQFSSEELILVFYYFIVFEDKQQTKKFIEENGFFKNLNEDLLLNKNHKSLYKNIAYM